MWTIETPYLLFLGEAGSAADDVGAKTAQGVYDWRPDSCVGQTRSPGSDLDLGLPDMTPAEAVKAGAKTLIVGVANRGGRISPTWIPVLKDALEAGLDLASGLHQRLRDQPELAESAARLGRKLHDVRHWPGGPLPVGDGVRRAGKRVLIIGTDCAVGKNYTALALEAELKRRGVKATFRATGQTGVLISGAGIAIDAVPADFVSGAVEMLCPENEPDHWDVIEGQASVLHPSFAAVTTGLVHGAQPDAMIVAHEADRAEMRGLPGRETPSLVETIQAHISTARVTNPQVRAVAVSLNTRRLDEQRARAAVRAASVQTGLPATDPIRFGAGPLADALPGLAALSA
ncbi:MAG: N-acetyltransferase DgcN [Oceanicaulis sp.]